MQARRSERGDLGYAPVTQPRPAAAFAGFARRRLAWCVDVEQITLVPDVMAGPDRVVPVLAAPGERAAFVTPGYPPFFAELPQAGVRLELLPLAPGGSTDLVALEAALAAGCECSCSPIRTLLEVSDAAREHGIALTSALMDPGREGAGSVRLNFVTSPEHVEDAVRRMAAAL